MSHGEGREHDKRKSWARSNARSTLRFRCGAGGLAQQRDDPIKSRSSPSLTAQTVALLPASSYLKIACGRTRARAINVNAVDSAGLIRRATRSSVHADPLAGAFYIEEHRDPLSIRSGTDLSPGVLGTLRSADRPKRAFAYRTLKTFSRPFLEAWKRTIAASSRSILRRR